MTSSFDPEGLWLKSRLFINRALDDERDFDEQAFWACSALELLGKSALARLSPLLIANPADDGTSLLVASGAVAGGNATSVPAKAVWSRCQRAFKPFNEAEAKKIALGRNEYIHAAGVGFDAIPAHAWWPRFWSQAVVLLSHMGMTIDDFVDPSHLEVVNAALATRKETVKHQLEARIERARTMLLQFEAETLSARQLKEWERTPQYSATYSEYVECPACADQATLYGDDVLNTEVDYLGADDWGELDLQVTLTVAPHALVCDNCRLALDYDLLVEAGLDEAFEVEGSGEDIEYEPEYENE